MAQKKQTRAERERSRLYNARRRFHERQGRRRVRDNIVGGAVGGALIVGLLVVQSIYFTAGPGVPVPTETETVPGVEETAVPTPNVSDLPIQIPEDPTETE